MIGKKSGSIGSIPSCSPLDSVMMNVQYAIATRTMTSLANIKVLVPLTLQQVRGKGHETIFTG